MESGGVPPGRFWASLRPVAHVPPSSMLASGNDSCVLPMRSHTSGWSASSSATVSARHSITSGDDG